MKERVKDRRGFVRSSLSIAGLSSIAEKSRNAIAAALGSGETPGTGVKEGFVGHNNAYGRG